MVFCLCCVIGVLRVRVLASEIQLYLIESGSVRSDSLGVGVSRKTTLQTILQEKSCILRSSVSCAQSASFISFGQLTLLLPELELLLLSVLFYFYLQDVTSDVRSHSGLTDVCQVGKCLSLCPSSLVVIECPCL